MKKLLKRALSYSIRMPISDISKLLVKQEFIFRRLTRDDIISKLESNNWDGKISPHAEKFRYQIPTDSVSFPEEIENSCKYVEFDNNFVVEIPDVRLKGKKALAITSNNKFIPEKEADRADLLSRGIGWYISDKIMNLGGGYSHHYELAIPLTGPMSHTYYHWFSDYLMRLELIFDYINETKEYPTILLPKDAPNWIIKSIEYTGYPEEKVEMWPGGEAFVDRLVIPSSRRQHCEWRCRDFAHYSPKGYRWVRDRILKNAPNTGQSWPEVLVISRADAGTREILNRDQLIASIEKEGYDVESYQLESLDLSSQISLFNSVDIIVGAHGAGLLNTIFSENTSVVELYSQKLFNAAYFSISQAMGHKYVCLEVDKRGNNLVPDEDKVIEYINEVQ